MDNRPIGVFDSGLGGLTCVRELERRMPHESVIYFGDTGRVPYGGRSREIITKYARQDVAFLRTHDLKAIVIACGTVSSTAISELKAEQDIPVFGVVEPTALKAVESTRKGKIGLIATRATIATGAYEKIMLERDPNLEVHAAACPLFVPLVENGRTQPGDVVIETVVKDYLTPLKEAGIDTLVLGCTHYPLIREVIQNFMGPEVTLVDSGAEVAHQVERYLTRQDQLSGLKERGHCQWFVSDSQQGFRDLACCFLGRPVVERVGRVDIERY
ncbi:MAG: glutamate racemase [Oscillospiraceae bacterium]|nr:glutamate racemase [Oscillospiraceae bacterium]